MERKSKTPISEELQTKIRYLFQDRRQFENQVKKCIKKLENHGSPVIQKNLGRPASPEEIFTVLRASERACNTLHIIQYMHSFLSLLPGKKEISREPVDPFRQFCSFVMNLISQLNEKDVQAAIIREQTKRGLLDSETAPEYLEKTRQFCSAICRLLQTATLPEHSHYRKLFQCIQQYCTFWFSVHNQDSVRVRECDRIMYQLSGLLLKKTARH